MNDFDICANIQIALKRVLKRVCSKIHAEKDRVLDLKCSENRARHDWLDITPALRYVRWHGGTAQWHRGGRHGTVVRHRGGGHGTIALESMQSSAQPKKAHGWQPEAEGLAVVEAGRRWKSLGADLREGKGFTDGGGRSRAVEWRAAAQRRRICRMGGRWNLPEVGRRIGGGDRADGQADGSAGDGAPDGDEDGGDGGGSGEEGPDLSTVRGLEASDGGSVGGEDGAGAGGRNGGWRATSVGGGLGKMKTRGLPLILRTIQKFWIFNRERDGPL